MTHDAANVSHGCRPNAPQAAFLPEHMYPFTGAVALMPLRPEEGYRPSLIVFGGTVSWLCSEGHRDRPSTGSGTMCSSSLSLA